MLNPAPTPGSCPNQDQLLALIQGVVPPDDARLLQTHLEHCQHCKGLYQTLFAAQHTRLLPNDADNSNPSVAPDQDRSSNRPTVSAPAVVATSPRAATRVEEAALPRRIGQYRIVGKLGRGGMGLVLRGWHPRLKKWVAVKLLSSAAMNQAAALTRFNREMQLIARLQHPNIIRATDAGEDKGIHYLVMDLVEGMDLAHLVRQVGPLGVADAVEIIRQAALALAHAHEHQLVHRDLKPSNLILSTRGEVKMLDLGLALLRGEAAIDSLTPTGQLMGTADYMAPEQWEACHQVDIRADIYSLGCTLFYLLTGRAPFPDPAYSTLARKMSAHLRLTPPSVTQLRPEIPVVLAALLERMLAKDPAERPQDPETLSVALTSFTQEANLLRLVQSLHLPAPPAAPEDLPEPDCPEDESEVPTQDSLPRTLVDQPSRGLLSVRRATILAMGAALIAAVCLVVFRPDFGASTPPPPGPRVFRKGVWTDLLDRPPEVIHWWAPAGDSAQVYNPESRSLTVQTFSTALLGLGQTTATTYRLRLGMQQTFWSGNCGLFLGGRKIDGGHQVQFLQLRNNLGPNREFGIARGICTIQRRDPDNPLVTLSSRKSHQVLTPEGREYFLEVTVGTGGVHVVRWDGSTCPLLMEKGLNDLFSPEDYRGTFGIFCGGGSAVIIRTALFMPLE